MKYLLIFKKYKLVLLGICVIILFWLIETLLHNFIFTDPEQSMLDNLVNPPVHEMWMRVVVVFLLITLSIYFQLLFNKIKASREKVREEEAKFHLVFENAADAILWADIESGKIINCNIALETLLEKKKNEIIGQHFSTLHPLGELEHTKKGFEETIKKGKVVSREVTLISKTGKLIPSLVTGSITSIGGNKINLGIFHDITNRKQAEQKLRESEEKYHEAYDRADFYKNIVIHDMSNVLQNASSSVELINSLQNTADSSNNLNKLIRIIETSIKRGTKLISNVRKLSTLEYSKIIFQPTDIFHVLNESINFLRKSFKDREINVQIDSIEKKILVRADELLLDVFENLLINATKFTHNSVVFIKIKICKEKQGDINFIRLEFIDNGIGITEKNKNAIFQKGFKKDENTRGMGIGLSLVKTIIDSYEGKIWVEDKVKGDYTKGSNFILLIPETN